MLLQFIQKIANKLGIPGVSVGVWNDGEEIYGCHGVTSLDNPLSVDSDTLFEMGSVTKTFTATTLMALVARGEIELDAPIRRYVPELRLRDERAAAEITVLNLLNHTAGFDWAMLVDTGAGDDALATYVAKLQEAKLIAQPGARASYSQTGYNLAGRIIEKVTGLTYENAVATLLFQPIGLTHSFFLDSDVMTRRFVVGHNPGEDGKLAVPRQWRRWRSNNPGGGLVSSARDQLRWAQFHLGDGRSIGGRRVLPADLLAQMKEATVALRGSSLGDAFGICWFLRDIDGLRAVGHAGSAHGQFAELLTVPQRNFAVVSLANAGPNGIRFNQAVVHWALEHYLGAIDRDPVPMPYDAARARELVGTYESDAMRFIIAAGLAEMTLEVGLKPEIRAASQGDVPPDYSPAAIGLLPGDGDNYMVTDGGLKGQRGFFTRDGSGAVVGVDLAGRIATRVSAI